VIPTHAGDPSGRLVKRLHTRYIFHTATIMVEISNDRQIPVLPQDSALRTIIHNCLDKVREINEDRGVISAEGMRRYDGEIAGRDGYQPIKSIIFPIFSTGQGGRVDLEKVTRLIAAALKEYIGTYENDPLFTLEHIHVCAYSREDCELASNALQSVLG
jgi:O-acetyl-ADP-ribose deacetylase (regulator of RNase III)